jgi:DNA polymerase zeta
MLPTVPQTLSFQLTKAYQQCTISGKNCYSYSDVPPSKAELTSLEIHKLPTKLYQSPFYSNEADTPERSREFAGLVYYLKGRGISSLEEFETASGSQESPIPQRLRFELQLGWEYAAVPPSGKFIRRWLQHEKKSKNRLSGRKGFRSQVCFLCTSDCSKITHCFSDSD